jgi:hypothetical protein
LDGWKTARYPVGKAVSIVHVGLGDLDFAIRRQLDPIDLPFSQLFALEPVLA